MKAQMITRNTPLIVCSAIAAVGASALIFGMEAFALTMLVFLALAAPGLALWRRSATGIAGPEPEEAPEG